MDSRRLRAVSLVVAALLLAGPAAVRSVAAHSLDEVESRLGQREKYFQPIDKEAPPFSLQDASGRRVELDDLRGKIVVLHFIYASCPDVCPLHADKIAEVQELVNPTPMKDQVVFVSITTDPARDTSDVLRAFGPLHGLDPANWMFLTTRADQAEDATRRLAEAFGHKFAPTEDGLQVHGTVTHIIDQAGRWRANFHGLDFESTSLVVFVSALANDPHGPDESDEPGFWDRVRELF